MEQAAHELSKLGYRFPSKTKLRKRIPKHEIVIGGFFRLEEGLRYPDNVITTCAACHTALQIRPRVHTGKPVMCCFCVADQAIQAYWEEKKASTPRGRPR